MFIFIIEEVLKKLRNSEEVWIEARNLALKQTTPNSKMLDVAENIESLINEKAGCGFPVNLSLNEEAAHYTPLSNSERKFGNSVVKVDIGVETDGWIVDAAFTIDLTNNHLKQINVNKEALNKAIDYIIENKENSLYSKIGEIIETQIKSSGFKPIYNLTGHSIDRYQIHSNKSIFNYKTDNNNKLGTGIFAIEPFTTNGSGFVKSGNFCGIYFYNGGNARDRIQRKLINDAREFKGLPFAERNIGKKIDFRMKQFALNMLVKNKIFAPANVLIDPNAITTQFEKTIYITSKKVFVFPDINY